MNQTNDRVKDIIRIAAAEFFSRESNRTSLITVTGVELRNRGERAKILVTVLPEHQAHAALDFIHRQLAKFREYVSQNTRLMKTPFFDIALDEGEKNRQRIDEIEKSI